MNSIFFETPVRIINSKDNKLAFKTVENNNYNKKLFYGLIQILLVTSVLTICTFLPEDAVFLFFLFCLYVIGFANYYYFEEYRDSKDSTIEQNTILAFKESGILMTQNDQTIRSIDSKNINSITIEKDGRYHFKITINEEDSNTFNLLVKNLFIKPNINNDINTILNLEHYAESSLGNKNIIIAKKKDFHFIDHPRFHKMEEYLDGLKISITNTTISIDHSKRNISTQPIIGPKRYISFDDIEDYYVESNTLAILDTDGHKFILHKIEDSNKTITSETVHRRKEFEFIAAKIDAFIKDKVIESLDTLELKPLPEIKKNEN